MLKPPPATFMGLGFEWCLLLIGWLALGYAWYLW